MLEHARQNGEGNGGALFYFKTNIALENVNWFMVSRAEGLRYPVRKRFAGFWFAGLWLVAKSISIAQALF